MDSLLNIHQGNKIAYFCLEFGLENDLKTYAGGLGILAGDTAKSATDNNIDFIGITLLYHKGYFQQLIENDIQIETEDKNDFTKFLELTDINLEIKLKSKTITAKVWKYDLGKRYPHSKAKNNAVYFIDTECDSNDYDDRQISHYLYSKDEKIRTKQELVLGVGGYNLIKILDKHHYQRVFHLNESNAAFLIVALNSDDVNGQKLKERLMFTTHTPIPAGHKIYDIKDLEWCFTQNELDYLISYCNCEISTKKTLNMTKFCIEHAGFTNGVSQIHAHISSSMYPGFNINYITNGIHSASWASDSNKFLFDKYLPGWHINTDKLRNIDYATDEEILNCHQDNKIQLGNYLESINLEGFDPNVFTIGFARRVDPYKRHDFITRDLNKLQEIALKFGGLQLVFSGKSYPTTGGEGSVLNKLLKNISQNSDQKLKIFFIPNYGMEIGKLMVAGVDIWLNNPIKPLEASGTSGMKAQLNGVPCFSTIDGWWGEGNIEGITGWDIGDRFLNDENTELKIIFEKLENIIIPTFNDKSKWAQIMKNCIKINGTYFSAQRMVNEYYKGAL